MFIFLIVVIILVAAVYLYLALTGFFTQTTFLTAYKLEYQQSGVRSKAVESGLRVFLGRAPFDQLSENDVEELSRILGMVSDPMAAATLIRSADRKRDVSELKSAEFRSRMEVAFRNMANES